MSVSSEITRIQNGVSEQTELINQIQTALNSKLAPSPNLQSKAVTYTSNGTETVIPDNGFDGLSSVAVTVNVSSGSTASIPSNDITFYDYDGTIVEAWSLEELPNKTMLPDVPFHQGLSSIEWNWTLDELKAAFGHIDVGAIYTTDDSTTRVYVHIEKEIRNPKLGCCPNGIVTVDWGDGTTPDTLTGDSVLTTKYTPIHNYSEPGDYVITLTVDGTVGFNGDSSGSKILCVKENSAAINNSYCSMVKKIEFGENVVGLGTNAFLNMWNLESLVISSGITNIGSHSFDSIGTCHHITFPRSLSIVNAYAFNNTTSITSISFPPTLESVKQYSLFSMQNLRHITFPSNVTTIDRYTACKCNGLLSITLLGNISSIQDRAFQYCSSVRFIDFMRCASVPTLGSQSLYGIPSDCEIRVPAPLAADWKAATNWSEYASQIVGAKP